MTPSELQAAVDAVRTWVRGDQRAPHKPLLLLWALARVQRGEPRLVGFREAETPLRRLLAEFGPSRASQHPEYPFWRLQADGLWEVPGGDALAKRQSNNDPPITELRKASGGFPPDVDAALRAHPDLACTLAHAVLDAHFPASLHASLIAEIGLDLEPPVMSTTRRARARDFRELVLRAYGWQCAVCGLDARLDGAAIGLEAAHVHWHAHLGPDTLENGLCLCPLHHKALDLGLIGVSDNRHVLVSSRLHGSDTVEAAIGRFHAQPLATPRHGAPPVSAVHARWHGAQVFKKPSRPA
jgi:putative restriction endonuclease